MLKVLHEERSTSCNGEFVEMLLPSYNGHFFRILRICASVGSQCGFDSLQFREIVEILVAIVSKAAAHPSCQMVQHQHTQLSNVMLQIQLLSSTCIGRSQSLFRKLEYRCRTSELKLCINLILDDYLITFLCVDGAFKLCNIQRIPNSIVRL